MKTVKNSSNGRNLNSSFSSYSSDAIIQYTAKNIQECRIPRAEYDKAMKKYKDYEMAVEAQDAENEVSQFEKKHFGEVIPPPMLRKDPLSQRQRQIVKQFSKTDEQYMYDTPTLRTEPPKTASSDFVMRPSYWSLVDEPLLLSRRSCVTRTECKYHTKPFILAKGHAEKCGIPVLSRDLQQIHKRNMKKLNEKMLLSQTFANQKQEERLRKSYEKSKNQVNNYANKRVNECARLGQKWAIRKLSKSSMEHTSLPSLRKDLGEKPLSKFDMEAINAVNEKVKKEIDEEKERLFLSTNKLNEVIEI